MVLKLTVFKLKFPKALTSKDVLVDIFKFAAANASMSAIFLLTRMMLREVRKQLELVYKYIYNGRSQGQDE